MKQLDNSILLLETSPYNAVKVEYADTFGNFSPIENNATKEILVTKYGSIKDFFEGLNAKGIKKIRVTDRKANGSTFKTIGASYEVTFTDGNTTMETPVQPQANVAPAMPAFNFGLNGGMQGLGMVEIHRIHDYDRLKTELAESKAKNIHLETENSRLKDENLRNELLGTKSVEKSKANSDLVEKLTPLLGMIAAKIMPPAGAVVEAGLGNPSPSFSAVKNQFLQFIQNADDDFLQDLWAVVGGMQNEDFDNELTELLRKHNLIAAV
jgi:hypothetical protein